MSPVTSSPIQNVPLHLISNILARLETVQQLGCAILSHRVFLAAFQDGPRAVFYAIVRNQVSDEMIPFAIALLASAEIEPRDSDAVILLLERLNNHILRPEEAAVVLANISLDGYAFISKNLDAADFLSHDLAREAIGLLNSRLNLTHSPAITPQEKFRLMRAFFRYQIMCNLFCLSYGNPLDQEERYRYFFHPFSPWVNQQILCVFCYLDRKVCNAFYELATRHVLRGAQNAICSISSHQAESIQELLSHGLPFLKAVACVSGSYDEKFDLLRLDCLDHINSAHHPSQLINSMAPEESLLLPLGLDDLDTPLQLYDPEQISRLDRPGNGPYDSIDSGPFRAWFNAHEKDSIFASTFDIYDQNLWECGYVIWDHLDMPTSQIQSQCQEMMHAMPISGNSLPWQLEELHNSDIDTLSAWV